MTTQFIELETINDEPMQAATGGGMTAFITNSLVGMIPFVGSANNILDLVGGPSVGSLVEELVS